VAKHATVDEYIGALPEQLSDVAADARRVIDANLDGADSAIKAASKHVTFGFWHGASIADPSRRLETSGGVVAHVKLRDRGDVDEELFANWLRQAREIELAQ
jgi:hypothetical protein